MLWSASATAMAPIDETLCLSKVGIHVMPPSVLLKTPPATAPK